MTTKNRPNPFDPAQPARETFVGREALLKELVHSLQDGRSYELTGSRRIGKTALLREVQQLITEDPDRLKMSPIPVPVYIECSREDERIGPLFARITTALIQGLVQQWGCVCPLKVQRDAEVAAERENLTEALNVALKWAFEEVKKSFRPILVLDALHRITKKEVLESLLGAFNHNTDKKTVNVLLADQQPLVDCIPNSVSPLMMLTTNRDLGPLNEAETGALVAIALRLGWPVDAESAKLAYKLTNGHPYRLQYYLHNALEQYGEITPKSLMNIRRQNADERLNKLLGETLRVRVHAIGLVTDGKAVKKAPAGTKPSAVPASVIALKNSSKQKLVEEVTGLLGMDSISIDDHIVVGNYTRFDSVVAGKLRKDAKRIRDACHSRVGGYHNFLIWGSSGEGKTYFATEIAITTGIQWEKISLARTEDVPDAAAYKDRLAAVKAKDGPFLFIIDECDKRTDPWVCAALFDYLSFESNRNATKAQGFEGRRGKRSNPISKKLGPTGNKVFVLIGSTGDSVESFWAGMRKLPAGQDLETRIQPPPIIIPETTIGDRLLVVLSQIRRYAKESSRRVEMVEKLALAYVLLSAKGSRPRGIEEMVMQAVGRLDKTDTELQYSHFFGYHEDAEGAFVRENSQVYDTLHGRTLRLK